MIVSKLYNEQMEEMSIANHADEVLYIETDLKLPNFSMMRRI